MSTCIHPARRVPPLRILQRLSWRLKHAKAPSLAIETMDTALAAQERQLGKAIEDATAISGGLERVRQAMHRALTDHVSPGIITACEAREIAALMINTAVIAGTHLEHLSAMLN